MAEKNTDPKHVDISLSQGIQITWTDGHNSQYALEHLRKNCPCATCRHEQEAPAAATPASPFQMYKPTTRLTGAEAVGRYAVRLQWADGHNTGIYSFDLLRDLCPCSECQKANQTANP
jgi:DUF971 family protein